MLTHLSKAAVYLAIATLVASVLLVPRGAYPAELELRAGSSKLWLEGDSTLHRWSTRAQGFSATFDVEPGPGKFATIEALRAHRIRSLVLRVPVAELRSGEDGLDENLRKALHADRDPAIVFAATSYDIADGPSDAPSDLVLHGSLAIAGVDQDIDVELLATPTPEGLRITGSKTVRMSDHKVQAPVLMLGAIRTDDRVEVKFDLLLVAK